MSEDHLFAYYVADDLAESPPDAATHRMLRQKIEEVLTDLPFCEREIIRLRYGLDGGCTYSLEVVGRIFKVSRQRVHQLESRAINKIKHSPKCKELEGFL